MTIFNMWVMSLGLFAATVSSLFMIFFVASIIEEVMKYVDQKK